MSSAAITASQTISDGTLADCASALLASYDKLTTTVQSATALLTMTGYAGMRGDTADDLRVALAIHGHLVHEFNVKVRTEGGIATFSTQASCAANAFQEAADRQGDAPCGITVIPAEPDRAALVAAHSALAIAGSLDHALQNPALNVALHSFARKRRQRGPGIDIKRLAANDLD